MSKKISQLDLTTLELNDNIEISRLVEGVPTTFSGPLSDLVGLIGTSFNNPSASVGLAAVNGAASSAMRSDAAPPIDQGIAPTWSAEHIFSNAGSAIRLKKESQIRLENLSNSQGIVIGLNSVDGGVDLIQSSTYELASVWTPGESRGIILPKQRSLTTATPQDLFSLTCLNGNTLAGEILYRVSSGTGGISAPGSVEYGRLDFSALGFNSILVSDSTKNILSSVDVNAGSQIVAFTLTDLGSFELAFSVTVTTSQPIIKISYQVRNVSPQTFKLL